MFSNEDHVKTFFRFISQDHHKRSGERIDKAYVHKRNPNQVNISDIRPVPPVALHLLEDAGAPFNVFYGSAMPNLNCDVCFDHPLDHYPMMLAFEIGRQGALAVSHLFYDVPLDGYVCIVDTANLAFKQFMELDKPLYVVFVDSNIEDKKGVHKREMNTLFIQEGVVCAHCFGRITVLPKSMYRRFRLSSRSRVLQCPVGKTHHIPTNLDVVSTQAISVAS